MESVSLTGTAVRPPLRAVPRALAPAERLRIGRAATCTAALRARSVGGAEPGEMRKEDGPVLQERAQEEDEVLAPEQPELVDDEVLAPEQLELLEDEAMAGEDEGRSPTDYDRRAHVFEESSRVFRALKERRDGDGAAATRHGSSSTPHS